MPKVEMTLDEIENSRFYGETNARDGMLRKIKDAVEEGRETPQDYTEKTINKLNDKIGLGIWIMGYGSLGIMREEIKKAIIGPAPNGLDEEAMQWKVWLQEPSRYGALLMPELNSEECRRDRGLDKAIQGGGSYTDTTEPRDFQTQETDEDKKIRVKGDNNRRDDKCHKINSGQRDKDGYLIYWMQEGRGTDASRTKSSTAYDWTEELKAAHEKILNITDEKGIENGYDNLEEKAKEVIKNAREMAEGVNDAEKKEKEAQDATNANKFRKKVCSETNNWFKFSVLSRFFRLTSLMGMDFFVSRGNKVRFVRDKNQPNYTGGGVNRAITDSEWAHAEDMGYVANGNVIRHNNDDRFHLV